MQRMKHVILIFCAIAMLLLCSCHDHGERFEENPFPDYQVHDYHLRYLHHDEQYGRYHTDFNGGEGAYFLEYYRIDAENPPRYVGIRANAKVGGDQWSMVLQSKTDMVDILREWTFDSAEFFLVPLGQDYPFYERHFRSGDDLSEPVYFTKDDDVYRELLALMDSPNKIIRIHTDDYGATQLDKSRVPESDAPSMEVLSSCRLIVRLVFEESNVIVWETSISHLKGRYLEIDLGDALEKYHPEYRTWLIERDSAIYRAVIAALEAYAAQ